MQASQILVCAGENCPSGESPRERYLRILGTEGADAAVRQLEMDLLSVPYAGVRAYVSEYVPNRLLRCEEAARFRRFVQRQSVNEQWLSIDWAAEIERKDLERVVSDAVAMTLRMVGLLQRPGAIPDSVLLHEYARPLREKLMHDEGWLRIMSALALQPHASESMLHEFLGHLKGLGPEAALRVWADVVPVSPHREWLEAHMPPELRVELETRQHQAFFEAWRALDSIYYRPSDVTQFDAMETYGLHALTSDDRSLVDSWVDDKNNEYERAKMLSARAAEKAMMRFYERLGCIVQDVSIEQLEDDPRLTGWTTHDLLVDGRPVDVKNSRPPNSVSGYSEHTVKRFKRDERDQEVTIAGVRSPYLQLKYLDNPKLIPSHWSASVRVLGECTRALVDELRADFTSPTLLHDLSIDRGRRAEEFLPPWVFNYPEVFYAQEDGSRYRAAVAEFVRQTAPTWEAVHGLTPLPYYLQKAKPLPESWRANIQPWQASLADRIMSGRARSSLPHLFLTVLTDFLAAVQEQRANYNPFGYYPLLYKGLDYYTQSHLPLGIYDPRESVWGLISTTSTLWEHREASLLLEFKRFIFTGAGLLRGTRPGKGRPVSLLAWCGGCGKSPLVLGVQEACKCGYLICGECGYCMADCESCHARVEGHGL